MKIDLTVSEFKQLFMEEETEPEKWIQLLDENQCPVSGYEVSDLGRIRKNGVIKKLSHQKGYLVTRINGEQKRVHRLVLQSFKPTDDRSLLPDHIDNNGKNNRPSNLQWLTNAENTAKGFKQNGTRENFQKVRGINLENGEVKKFESLADAGRYLDRNHKTIADAVKYGYKVAGSWIFDKENDK